MKKLIVKFIENWFKYTQLKINLWMLRDKIRYYRLMYSGKVLDIGAGTKPYRELFDEVSEYIGTNTRRHYEINNLVPDIETTDVWIEDGTNLPFEDGTFDGVVCFQVLPLIAHPDKFFREVNRVLRTWGYFMVTSDYLYPAWSEEDYMRHSRSNLVSLACENGFIVLATESFGGIFTTIYSLVIRYFRSYPDRIKAVKHPLCKAWLILWLMVVMALSPLSLIAGPIIYILERGKRRDYNYTMNQFILMRKRL